MGIFAYQGIGVTDNLTGYSSSTAIQPGAAMYTPTRDLVKPLGSESVDCHMLPPSYMYMSHD